MSFTLYCTTDTNSVSPTTNQNLLSRSEVVALINTLHRLVESLHYVENFRKLWANAPEEESKELIREAESAVVGHVRFHLCDGQNAMTNHFYSHARHHPRRQGSRAQAPHEQIVP